MYEKLGSIIRTQDVEGTTVWRASRGDGKNGVTCYTIRDAKDWLIGGGCDGYVTIQYKDGDVVISDQKPLH